MKNITKKADMLEDTNSIQTQEQFIEIYFNAVLKTISQGIGRYKKDLWRMKLSIDDDFFICFG